ncbi:MAG: hypothetical protein FP813_00720 [Desulfurivibrio sp.]|nr:hypothetical protein [Desulfurivibrio sp.]MBU3936089.1 hypothetical protein [Pseudomonadota bacterium]MBU4034216.1 hypothetical protein [Pseudomonadota bacterium]MBU4117626.1 hypothetical protein [Pseudomonadota bacterium]
MSLITLWLESLLTPCPRYLRRMGFLREQLAIEDRYQRNRASWEPHLTRSRAAILAAADSCTLHRTALILGGGLINDIPLAELAERFQQVVLADILHLPRNRRKAEAVAPNITCLDFDCTGAVEKLYQAGNTLADEPAITLFRHASPTLPPALASGCDLTVSVNLASQLGYLPAKWLAKGRPRDDDFSLHLRRAAALCHLEWLQALPGERLLIGDRALVVRGLDESEVEREVLLGEGDLESPCDSWVWKFAPAPEWDKRHHLELEVGAYVLGRRPFRSPEDIK